jgi:signal transduction histidine kinase
VGVSAREQLAKDIDTIERAYEFFLAYAAQGLGREAEGTRVEGQFREYLTGMLDASNRLAGTVDRLLDEEQVSSRTQLIAFRSILQADAARAAAALALVQAQPVATSQLVDNLNASIHVRTLLTDLFLLDEVLELAAGKAASEV